MKSFNIAQCLAQCCHHFGTGSAVHIQRSFTDTNRGNEIILDNCRKIAENGGKMQIRIPVIPMFNHDEENIRKTAEFCVTLGDAVTVIQLLPYHNLGVSKYLRISDKPVMEATPPTDEYMEKLKAIMQEYGLPVTIH